MRILLLLFAAAISHAEVFLGPTTQSNRLIIASNEVLRASVVIGHDPGEPSDPAGVWLIASGFTNRVGFSSPLELGEQGIRPPMFLVGPAEFVITNRYGLSFQRIYNTGINWIIVREGGPTNILTVPAGKTVHFLQANNGYGGNPTWGVPCTVTVGTNTLPLRPAPDVEISGPATIAFSLEGDPGGPVPYGYAVCISYLFVEDAVVLPGERLLMGGTGNFEILIERSSNLETWVPIIAHQTSAEQKQFYRMRLRR